MNSSMRITVNINEKDTIKLILEFLNNRDLYISMLDLERETGVINGIYSDDVLFLRQLILDGQWDDVIEFIQPLKSIDTFNWKHFNYVIMKHQYLELLCLKCEASNAENQVSVDQLVNYLNELRIYCPSEDEYKKLCLLLTSPRLQDHSDYRNWNPSNSRVQCFKEVYPLVSKYLQLDKSQNQQISQNDRLFQLITKGLLYESCVEYCQARATQTKENYSLTDSNILLMQSQLQETDASLLSWLHALPHETFSCPFEEKSLKINMDRFTKPNLEATWADVILTTPIKPKQLFPYNAVPTGRSRNTELMSRSLAPQYDGLSFGLNRSQIFNGFSELSFQPVNNDSNTNQTTKTNQRPNKLNDISRSIALFSLNDTPQTTVKTPQRQSLNGILEEDHPQQQQQQQPQHPVMSANTPSASISTTRNKIQESTSTSSKATSKQHVVIKEASYLENASMNDSSLFKEYKKNKANLVQQLEEQEKKREEFLKQIKMPTSTQTAQSTQRSQNTVVSPTFDKSPVNVQQQTSPISPIKHQQQISPPLSTQQQSNVKSRPIEQATKFDSLEDLTRSPAFIPVNIIEDQQAIRAVDIHPNGKFYAIGSNSKYLRICAYPSLINIRTNHVCKPATVVYKKGKHHYGSIYCTAWNMSGSLLATGSNDKTIKVLKFSPEMDEQPDTEIELTHHNGTVRDLIFMQQDKNNYLVSGGAGDCKLYVTDCLTQQIVRNFSGHDGHIYALYAWSNSSNVFVSGSQDKTCRFWDLRLPDAVQTINCNPNQGSPVASVAVDPSGQLLASGHEDSACVLYDIRGSRCVQIFKPHSSDIRSVRFSTNAYYLLTASYDGKVVVTDLQGDLTKPLKYSTVAQHNDKIIQARWHPREMSFITTSADRTAVIWALPTSSLNETYA